MEILIQEKDFWADNKKAAGISKELAELKEEIDTWEKLEKDLAKIKDTSELSAWEERFKKEEIKALFSGPYDKKHAVISIYSGAGGTEAQDWANMLLRMYIKYSESHNFKSKLIDISYGQETGIKSAVLEISGQYAFGYLKGENGVHRLVRLSPFNANNLRQTSFALVEILPEVGEDIQKEIEIKPDELKMDTFRASGPGGQNVNMRSTAVRLTYLPTKLVVSCQSERSQAQNREKAMGILYAKIYQARISQLAKEKKDLRGIIPSAEWGSQIRSYVLHPYKMVKDHRTDIESSDPDAILDGNLDEFIEAELKLI